MGLVRQAQALRISPRCTEDTLSDEQAAGRNQWLKSCHPDLYNFAFSEGDEYTIDGVPQSKIVYVTFGVQDPSNKGKLILPGNWKAPVVADAPCELEVVDGRRYSPIGVCLPGCYEPRQVLRFKDGWETVEEAAGTRKSELITLSSSFTLERLSTQISSIKS